MSLCRGLTGPPRGLLNWANSAITYAEIPCYYFRCRQKAHTSCRQTDQHQSIKLLKGVEPLTSSLPRTRSTTELQQRILCIRAATEENIVTGPSHIIKSYSLLCARSWVQRGLGPKIDRIV